MTDIRINSDDLKSKPIEMIPVNEINYKEQMTEIATQSSNPLQEASKLKAKDYFTLTKAFLNDYALQKLGLEPSSGFSFKIVLIFLVIAIIVFIYIKLS